MSARPDLYPATEPGLTVLDPRFETVTTSENAQGAHGGVQGESRLGGGAQSEGDQRDRGVVRRASTTGRAVEDGNSRVRGGRLRG